MSLLNSALAQRLSDRMQSLTFTDKALLLVPVASGTYDEYNNPVTTTTYVPISCSFTDTLLVRDLEMWKADMEIEQINALLRYVGTVPEKGWQVQLTERHGEPYRDPRTYEIIGILNRGAFGWFLSLKLVTV